MKKSKPVFKKVLILSSSDKRHMAMVNPYVEYFQKNNISFDIIRSNRYSNISKNQESNIYEFNWDQAPNASKIKKIIPYLRFRKFAIKIMKRNDYSFVVVWNENTAFLFSSFLRRKFKNHFCINIRDVYDHIPFYAGVVNKVCRKACFVTHPSFDHSPKFPVDSFKHYVVLVNRDNHILRFCQKKTNFTEGVIRITYMGFYHSAPDTFKKIALSFKNDTRFELHFYGLDFDTVFKDFCLKNDIQNVVLGGAFAYEKTADYLSSTDLINSYYNNFQTNRSLIYAMGIKESYSPLLYLPAIVDDNTTWGRIGRKYGISYNVGDDLTDLPNNLYKWYKQKDFEEFRKACDRFNVVVDKQYKELIDLCNIYIINND